jgi:hypothetical protein
MDQFNPAQEFSVPRWIEGDVLARSRTGRRLRGEKFWCKEKLRETIRMQCVPVVEGSFIGTPHINAM